MEFLLLGPIEVRDGPRRVAPGGPQAVKALAVLLLAGGRVVGLDALIDALWDGEPPATATHQVHKVVAELRRRLPGLVETSGRGYRLQAERHLLDVHRFTALAGHERASELVAALALWRGPALAGVDSRVLRTTAAALDEQRLAVLERLTDLRLAAGDAAAVAAELPAVIAAHPLRETLRRQLMTALYRSGRRADALAVYGQTRALLADELGLDPGPELSRLHEQILRADPILAAEPDPPPADREVTGPSTLPYDLPDFAGRGADLDRLLHAGEAVVITAIDGMAGIGKTALAVHAAHRLAERFPDGQLFCDLHAHTPGSSPLDPSAALERLLRMLGIPPETVPEDLAGRIERWRAELAGRRVLVVLDNASSAAQVRPLLPGAPGCLALITSRRRLGVVEGATLLSLDVLPPAEALDLFGAVAGRHRVADEPAAAEDVIRLCGHLPLAIRIAATRLAHRPGWTVAALADRLAARSDRLAELTLADRGVGPAFALSYAHLTAGEQRMFRLLGVHPGADFDALSAAALTRTAPAAAERVLEALVDAHLLQSPRPGRYTFHDLLREYARGLAPATPEPAARLYDYYLAAATAATDLVGKEARRFTPRPARPPAVLPELPDLDAALAWLGAEHATLVAVALAAADWQLTVVLRAHFEQAGQVADWRETHERALATAGPYGTALLHFGLGGLSLWTGDLAAGTEHLRQALGTGDVALEATILTSLGMLAHLRHRDLEAAGYLRRALALDHDNGRTRAFGWNNLAMAEGRLGYADAALAHHRRALALARSVSPSAVRTVLLGLGETSLRLGRPAVAEFRQALALARDARFPMHEALALDGLAHATGDAAYWREALAIFARLGVDQADLVRRHLAEPARRWCDLCAAPPASAGRASTVDARPDASVG